jgi:uncharacterized phage protein gp47/JayE
MALPFVQKDFDTLVQDYTDNLAAQFTTLGITADLSSGTPLILIGKPVAFLIEEIYEAMAAILFQRDVRTATGEFLDTIAFEVDLVRTEAQKATGTVRFSRSAAALVDYLIPTGTQVSTTPDPVTGEAVVFETTEPTTIFIGNTFADAAARAVVGGISGNVATARITTIVSSVLGPETVTNLAPFENGVDAETDEDFRDRIIYRMQNPIQGGTETDLINWTLEVAGSTKAAVIREHRGIGTADILFLFNEGIPNTTQIFNVQVYIDARKYINADIKVIAPTAYSVDVTAVITEYVQGFDPTAVRAAVEDSLEAYIHSVPLGAAGGKVRVVGLENAIFITPGVKNFTMSVPTADHILTQEEAAIPGTISIT